MSSTSVKKSRKKLTVTQLMKKHKNIGKNLQQFPEIRSFIRDLCRVIKNQDKHIRSLKSNFEKYKSDWKDRSAKQTIDDIENTKNEDADVIQKKKKKRKRDQKVECFDESKYERRKEQQQESSQNISAESETRATQTEKDVVNDITQAAQDAVQNSGFVFEETSGLYYDYKTGYYYNAEYGLYYDGNTGTYLKYNNETKQFEFYSQVDLPQTNQEKKPKKMKIVMEEGECSTDSECSDTEMKASDNDPTNGETVPETSETTKVENSKVEIVGEAIRITPCIRMIVNKSESKNLNVGALFIVTCDGGTVGREGNHTVLIPEILASKHHAKIYYNCEKKIYEIVDLGSRNGTFLDGKRISASKQESEPVQISHQSVLQIGNVKLMCHIHEGTDTCADCEPGIVQNQQNKLPKQIEIKKLGSLSKQYRLELNRLKKKFAASGDSAAASASNDQYTDRAEIRRKTVGGFNHAEKTQMASLDESIRSENKGFKLLEKMGWKEGDTLGKDSLTGLKEPIPLVSNEGKAGLGSGSS